MSIHTIHMAVLVSLSMVAATVRLSITTTAIVTVAAMVSVSESVWGDDDGWRRLGLMAPQPLFGSVESMEGHGHGHGHGHGAVEEAMAAVDGGGSDRALGFMTPDDAVAVEARHTAYKSARAF